MTFEPVGILAISWLGLFWGMGAAALFFLGLLLILVILIQDSQGGGLGGSFGGGGGDSILGARAQKGISKFTGIMGAIFALTAMCLGRFNPGQDSTLPGDQDTTPVIETEADTSSSSLDGTIGGIPVEIPAETTGGAAGAGTSETGSSGPATAPAGNASGAAGDSGESKSPSP